MRKWAWVAIKKADGMVLGVFDSEEQLWSILGRAYSAKDMAIVKTIDWRKR